MPEETNDGQFDHQNYADEHAQRDVDDRAGRKLDLVVPKTWDHLGEEVDVQNQICVTQPAMEMDEWPRRGALQFFLVVGIAPQVVHQERGRYSNAQERNAEQ